jgi:hypothetical protein
MRCVMSRLCREGRITLQQHATAKRWNSLSRAYRSLLTGSHDMGDRIGAEHVERLSSARLDEFERQVIRRYRALAPIMGALERGIIEGCGRYPRDMRELCAVRVALERIAKRWEEVA